MSSGVVDHVDGSICAISSTVIEEYSGSRTVVNPRTMDEFGESLLKCEVC